MAKTKASHNGQGSLRKPGVVEKKMIRLLLTTNQHPLFIFTFLSFCALDLYVIGHLANHHIYKNDNYFITYWVETQTSLNVTILFNKHNNAKHLNDIVITKLS